MAGAQAGRAEFPRLAAVKREDPEIGIRHRIVGDEFWNLVQPQRDRIGCRIPVEVPFATGEDDRIPRFNGPPLGLGFASEAE